MIKITLEFPTVEDAILALANIRNPVEAPPMKPVKVTAGKSATTAEPVNGKPGAADGPKDAAEKKEPASSGSATVDAYEPVGAMIKKYLPTHRAQILAVLGEFNVPNGKELKPDQYPAFMEKLTAAVTPAADLG